MNTINLQNNPSNNLKNSLKSIYLVPKAKVFYFIHLLPLCALFYDITSKELYALLIHYIIGMFFITAVLHRYFSHRTYKLNRFFQFIFAFMAQGVAQRGILWWASLHRKHHRYSDTPQDSHSRKLFGFFYSHFGWFFDNKHRKTDYEQIKDYAKYPELVWLNENDLVPAFIIGGIYYLIGGAPMLFLSFFGGLVLLWHGTFTINSLSHSIGTQRYKTGDESRNNPFLALITLGEGWHNNHHHYMHATRQGFFWWEFDITFYILKFLSLFGIVKNMRPVTHQIKTQTRYKESLIHYLNKLKNYCTEQLQHQNDIVQVTQIFNDLKKSITNHHTLYKKNVKKIYNKLRETNTSFNKKEVNIGDIYLLEQSLYRLL